MSYECVITTIQNIRPIKGADRIVLATASGYSVIVNIDSKEGDVVVLFPDDGQLSEVYANENNLIGYIDSITGERRGGFFTTSRRVKAQKFKGEKSEAYVASLDSFKFTGYDVSKLTVGTSFSELNGVPICNKYYTPATMRSMKNNTENKKQVSDKLIKERLKKSFPEHNDTAQIRFARNEQLKGLVTITAKLHGTSQRQTLINYPTEHPITNPLKNIWNVFVDEILHGKRHILNFWLDDIKASKLKFKNKVTYSWEHILGTRRVIKGIIDTTSKDYRHVSASRILPFVNKNECWYYEIVGFEETGRPIMNTVATKEMGKEFVRRFGDVITYKYGCLPEECEIYVYRITTQNEDGVVYELPWSVVKDKCNRAGIKHVPEIDTMLVKDINDVAKLQGNIIYYTDEMDIAEPLDESCVREGVCVRCDDLDTGKSVIWKSKTFIFKCLEGIVKNSDDYVDEEEAQGDIPDDSM